MGIHNEAQLDRKFLELAKLMNIYLNHFPSHEKYGLALTIRQKAYEMYGYMVEAQKRYHKKTALTNLSYPSSAMPAGRIAIITLSRP